MSSVVDPPGRLTTAGDATTPATSSVAQNPQPFLLTLWTDDPQLAASADAAGVDRVGLDLETLGKAERQSGLDTWISGHRIERLPEVGRALHDSRLFARVNPLWRGTGDEVEALLGHGVEVLMLPMFDRSAQVASLLEIVAGRATVVPLLETPGAVADVERLTELAGLREIHVGINDLALSLGLRNRFEVLESSELQRVSSAVLQAGLRLGIGGIGRLGDHSVPIAPDLLYAQYARLGSSCALLSRGYVAGPQGGAAMRRQIMISRSRLEHWRCAGPEAIETAHRQFRAALRLAEGW